MLPFTPSSRSRGTLQRGLAVLLTSLVLPITHAADEFSKNPDLPEWVAEFEVDLEAPLPGERESQDVQYLLIDEQIHVENKTEYAHFAYRVISESGVQDNSSLSFDFDPTFQTFALHRLRVIRDGHIQDRLDETKVDVLQRESGAERQLYDGHLTASILLDDVRVGDIIEYAYSSTGRNPVFEGKFSWSTSLQWSVPLHQHRLTLLWSSDREMRVRTSDPALMPEIQERGGAAKLTIARDGLPPLLSEGDLPLDFILYPYLELSDYQNWNEVAVWAHSLYPKVPDVPAEAREKIDELRGIPDRHHQVMETLRWVQSEVRYVGLFQGIHSYRPYPLEEVMRRRFGDCKDKSNLLVTMLRQLGHEAHLALVSTDYRGAVGERLQSPSAFDHVVTVVEVDGSRYWLDPTDSPQAGTLQDLYFPRYGAALILEPTTQSLDLVPGNGFEIARMVVEETLTMEDYGGDATLLVRSTYSGKNADWMRLYLEGANLKETEQNYLNHYAQDFPDIESIAPLEILDSPDPSRTNEISVVERYSLKDVWQANPNSPGILNLDLYPRVLAEGISVPDTRARTQPFALTHPDDVEHIFRVRLPTELGFEKQHYPTIGTAFRFSITEEIIPNGIDIHYHYKTRTHRVEAGDTAAFFSEIDQVNDLINYQIFVPSSYADRSIESIRSDPNEVLAGLSEPAWPLVMTAVFSLLFGCVFSGLVWLWDPAPPKLDEPIPSKLDGLGGFMVWVVIGSVLTPVFLLGGALTNLIAIDATTLAQLTTESSEVYHRLWYPALLFEVASLAFLLPFSLLVAIVLFSRRSSFPKLYIFMSLSLLAFYLADDSLVRGIPAAQEELDGETTNDAIRQLLRSAIWVPYMFLSRRVRLTFRRRRNSAEPGRSPAHPGPPVRENDSVPPPIPPASTP